MYQTDVELVFSDVPLRHCAIIFGPFKIL